MEVKIEVEKEEKKEYGKYDKWEVEGWVSSLMEAESIKADPEKMKYVKMCMEKKAKSMKKVVSSIDDIRTARQELQDEEPEYES